MAPFTTNGPRADGPADVGLAEQLGERIFVLAVMPRGALVSIASRMASAATATGATITEVRVTGCNGFSAAVAGCFRRADCRGRTG